MHPLRNKENGKVKNKETEKVIEIEEGESKY